MKSYGLDTSVILRLLVGKPELQAEKAKSFVMSSYASQTQLFVSDLVIAECYHALIYHYDVPKKTAVRTLLEFLSSSMITASGHAISALSDYQGTGAGLVDRLIRMDYLDAADEIATFDTDFAKQPNVTRLK